MQLKKTDPLGLWEHGDARRAIDFLRAAAEVAGAKGRRTIAKEHVDAAMERLRKERITSAFLSASYHLQMACLRLARVTFLAPEIEWYPTSILYKQYCNMLLMQAGQIIHGREPTSELVRRFESMSRKVIVCLDESDHIKEPDLLYTLARSSNTVVLISNQHSPASFDERIRSSLLLSEIEFKPYTGEEILSILTERIFHGLKHGTLDRSLLPIVAGMCSGDARVGLQVIKMAAREAESKGLAKITIEEIKNASRCVRKYSLPYLLAKLNGHQKAIYEILKRNREMESGKLYSEYCKSVKEPVVDRAYRNHMERMEELGLVKSQGSGRWKRYQVA